MTPWFGCDNTRRIATASAPQLSRPIEVIVQVFINVCQAWRSMSIALGYSGVPSVAKSRLRRPGLAHGHEGVSIIRLSMPMPDIDGRRWPRTPNKRVACRWDASLSAAGTTFYRTASLARRPTPKCGAVEQGAPMLVVCFRLPRWSSPRKLCGMTTSFVAWWGDDRCVAIEKRRPPA